MNRSIQVEGAFGVLKQDYGFGRFLTRGKTNNETRLFILAAAFNIRKLCGRLADGRFEKALFEPKNVMFGTPRVALLKKERGCCKYDLILQQPLQDFKAIAGMNDVKLYGGLPPCSFH